MKKISLSTEIKFILVFFFASTMANSFPFELEIINLIIVAALIFSLGNRKKSLKTVIGFIFLTVLYYLTLGNIGALQVLNTWTLIIRRLLIPFGLGYYFLYSTNISSLLASMERLKIPNMIIIPFLVMFRYLPALRDEYRNIKAAMKIRGIGTGVYTLKNPQLSLEYRLVPLLFSASNIGEELSQAAFSKGISVEGKKNRYFASKFSLYDYVACVYLLAVLYFLIR